MRSRLVLVALLLCPFVFGALLRQTIGLPELSTPAVRAAVEHMGPFAPAAFFGLVVFRQLLAIPAILVLSAGGICFGPALGTVLGAAGVVVSGTAKFWIARRLGRDWVCERFGAAFERFDRRIDRLGPVFIGLSTAHPLGVLSPLHWGAGLSRVSFAGFATAIVLGAPVRAFALSMLGASIAAGDSGALWKVGAAMAAVMLSPLAFPALRRRLFASD